MHGPNSKGAGVCGTNAPETHDDQQRDFANDGDAGKALATMKARDALCGCTLHELSDGYLVAKWNYSKAVPCLRAVGDLLRQIGGR
jgi:hypothetical protein